MAGDGAQAAAAPEAGRRGNRQGAGHVPGWGGTGQVKPASQPSQSLCRPQNNGALAGTMSRTAVRNSVGCWIWPSGT